MNTLLANGKVPRLIEGDEHTTMMTQRKEGAQLQGLMLDTNEERYKLFTQQAGQEVTIKIDLDQLSYQAPDYLPMAGRHTRCSECSGVYQEAPGWLVGDLS